MKFKSLLGFAGGGVRGVVSCVWLDKLIKTGHIDLDRVDSFSGTSTGSIITSALVKPNPFTPGELVELFKDLAKHVFKRDTWRPNWLDILIFSCPYKIKRLQEVLKSNLGDVRVGDCPKKFVIVIYDMDGRIRSTRASTILMVHNHKSFKDKHMLDWPLYKVVAGSCAAPTYFESLRFDDGKQFRKWTDGGQVDNLSVMSNFTIFRDPYIGGETDPEEIAVLSMGNGGRWSVEYAIDNSGWRTPRRFRGALNSIGQGNETLTYKALTAILGPRFFNLNWNYPKDVDLDGWEEVENLEKWARDKDLSRVRAWLDGYFMHKRNTGAIS